MQHRLRIRTSRSCFKTPTEEVATATEVTKALPSSVQLNGWICRRARGRQKFLLQHVNTLPNVDWIHWLFVKTVASDVTVLSLLTHTLIWSSYFTKSFWGRRRMKAQVTVRIINLVSLRLFASLFFLFSFFFSFCCPNLQSSSPSLPHLWLLCSGCASCRWWTIVLLLNPVPRLQHY